MGQDVEEIDADEQDQRLERVAAVDVAKATGKVCTRVPHPTVPNRGITKVWDVSAMTNAIATLADELAETDVTASAVASVPYGVCAPWPPTRARRAQVIGVIPRLRSGIRN